MLRYRLCDTVWVGENVVVPETKNTVAIGFDRRGSDGVGFGAMLSAVSFDDELVPMAGKVSKILAERDLLAETGFPEG